VMDEYRLETQIQRYIELYETSFRNDYEHHPEELRTLAHQGSEV